jgi:hypothetical protein
VNGGDCQAGVTMDLDGKEVASPASLTIARYFLHCHTASLVICRIPAKARPGRPLAVFLPGILTHLRHLRASDEG